MYIPKVYSRHNTLRYNANVKKKVPSDKIDDTKNALFFLSQGPAHHSFTFNLRFFCELKVRLSKTVRGISHFRFRFVFIKIYGFAQQMHGLFGFKTS